MRVFILGTGRCGTLTMSKACKCFSNFTSSHESKTRHNDLVYPDNHVEVDPHLFWHLPNLIEKYPDEIYVHLTRDKQSCVKSWQKRQSLDKYSMFSEMVVGDRHDIANKYYDFCNKMIDTYLCAKVHEKNRFKMNTPVTREIWKVFCNRVGESNRFEESLKVLGTKNNQSK